MCASSNLHCRAIVLVIAGLLGIGRPPPALHAQETPEDPRQVQTVLTGRVTDADTGEPLPAVNLFLSRTTRGTTTDSTGTYAMTIPPGSYELVVSMVGYKQQSISLELTGKKERISRDFALPPRVIETEEVRVSARENTIWRERFEAFRKQFLGRSYNARKTAIENPYPIDFEVDHLGTLTATAPEPLTIVNRALGYKIRFHLEEFRWNERLGSGRYSGDPFFEELEPRDDEQAERWTKNRSRAYHGSLRHFMRALIAGKSREEGFYVKRDKRATRTWKTDDPDLPARLEVANPGTNKPLWFRAIDADTLITSTDQPHLYELSFKGTLRIIYVGSPEDARLAFWKQKKPANDLWVSWLRLKEPSAYVHEQGYLYNPRAIVRAGAMSKRRMADMLPYNYAPE